MGCTTDMGATLDHCQRSACQTVLERSPHHAWHTLLRYIQGQSDLRASIQERPLRTVIFAKTVKHVLFGEVVKHVPRSLRVPFWRRYLSFCATNFQICTSYSKWALRILNCMFEDANYVGQNNRSQTPDVTCRPRVICQLYILHCALRLRCS